MKNGPRGCDAQASKANSNNQRAHLSALAFKSQSLPCSDDSLLRPRSAAPRDHNIPDLCVLAPVGRVFFLEIKTPVGRLSDPQRETFDRLVALGVPRAIVRSIEDVRRAFTEWRIETREAAHG